MHTHAHANAYTHKCRQTHTYTHISIYNEIIANSLFMLAKNLTSDRHNTCTKVFISSMKDGERLSKEEVLDLIQFLLTTFGYKVNKILLQVRCTTQSRKYLQFIIV